MKIPTQYKSLKYLHNIEWRDIFAVWRAYEAYQKMWKEHWTERGFSSWEEWRKNYINPINPESLQWSVYKVQSPTEDFPRIYGVPSRGWIKNIYKGRQTLLLKEVVDLLNKNGEKNLKIEAVRKNFPYQTMLTGVINNGRIVLVEGMHRAVALTMMKPEEMQGDVVLALAELKGELPSIGSGRL